MKIKNFFYLLLALPLMLAACEETVEPDPTPVVKDPVLTLTSDATVYIPAEGGEGEITYTLENAVEGVKVEANTEAQWITDLTVDQTITFVVTANEANEGRTAEIVVAYGEKNFTVSVQQLAADLKAPVLTLTSEAEMSFNGLGGDGQITYTLENPMAAYELEVTADAWITIKSTDEGVIAFTVATNDETARSGKVQAVYGDQSFEVTINQEANLVPTVIANEATVTFACDARTGAAVGFTLRNADASLSVTAEVNADWISNVAVGENEVTFDLAANDGASRSADMVLTYGESTATVTITQEGLNEVPFTIVAASASARTADVWDLVFIEHDAILGDIFTRLTVKLPENNGMHIPDGTYSVANGGILLCSATSNENSRYRYTSSYPADISDAELTVVLNKEAETAQLSGYFRAGSDIHIFSWDGAVDGFMYQEIGDAGITEWKNFYIYSQWTSNKYTNIKGNSAEGVNFSLCVYNGVEPLQHAIAAGTYEVDAWNSSKDLFIEGGENGMSKINNVPIEYGGTMTVEIVDEGYKLTFDFVDTNGNEWKGTYIGELPYTNYTDM